MEGGELKGAPTDIKLETPVKLPQSVPVSTNTNSHIGIYKDTQLVIRINIELTIKILTCNRQKY